MRGRGTAQYRIERIDRMVADIAEHPGWTRSALAEKYCLSERQIRNDLDYMVEAWGLPLVRHDGYRFERECSQCGRMHTCRV